MSDSPSNPGVSSRSPLPQGTPIDLVPAVLARTSGPPCGRFRELACDFVDGLLAQEWDHLARTHLEHCPDCSALVHAFRASAPVLPALAELDPGPWFSQRVLRATARKQGLTGSRKRKFWWEVLHRPRIALEAAYLGAAAVMMSISLPIPYPNTLVSPPGLIALKAPIHRTFDPVIQAERRTVAILKRTLRPTERFGSFRALGGRISMRIQAWSAEGRRGDPPPARNREPDSVANP